jgi:hypothetical protein
MADSDVALGGSQPGSILLRFDAMAIFSSASTQIYLLSVLIMEFWHANIDESFGPKTQVNGANVWGIYLDRRNFFSIEPSFRRLYVNYCGQNSRVLQ